MNKDKELKELLSDDPFDLLILKPSSSNNITADERLLSSFEEINQFYEKNNREPESNLSDITEQQLYFRLKGIRENTEKIASLVEYDRYDLLKEEIKPISNLDDIFDGDSLGILESDAESIFDLKHVKSAKERESADYVARRKPCKNFDDYEHLFVQVHADLNASKREIIPFNAKNLIQGNFYIANGMILYVEKIDITQEEKTLESGNRIRHDGRTRCIFENGTESDLLYRSLVKSLEVSGRSITKNFEDVNKSIMSVDGEINDEDVSSGFIYILKSKSDREEITSINNLYKIGYSNVDVAERIKNAENEPTYLMGPVSVQTYYVCYNLNPQKLESLVHRFLGDVQLLIDVVDNDGKKHNPREWYIAPLNVIEKTVELIINGRIIDYKYDKDSQEIISK